MKKILINLIYLLKIKEYLEGLCKDEFQKHYLEDAMRWTEDTILSWLKLVFGDEKGMHDE